MPGKPGSGGRIPKPQAQRRRRNKPEMPVDTVPAGAADWSSSFERPDADPLWHPIAKRWYDGLASSGQASFYEASDWAMAYLGADLMSRQCASDKQSAQMIVSILQITSSLLSTEGDRRRLRLELARAPQIDEDEEASVAALDDYRKRLGAGS